MTSHRFVPTLSIRARLLGVLWIAGAVSVACNVLAAEPTPVGRAVAAWPPISMLLVVEVLAQVPLPQDWRRWAAFTGATVVTATAAIASFHHMHHVAQQAGESPLVAALFPLTVDGLAIVASIALAGLHHQPPTTPTPAASRPHPEPAPTQNPPTPVRGLDPVRVPVPVGVSSNGHASAATATTVAETKTDYVTRRVAAWRRDYQRTRERNGQPADPDDFEQAATQARTDAETAWHQWHTNGQ